jgi:hypothetical protein
MGRRGRNETSDRLPPEPAAGHARGGGATRVELLLEVAENELSPLLRESPRKKPDGEERRPGSHLISRCRSSPCAIAVNAWYARLSAWIPAGRSA